MPRLFLAIPISDEVKDQLTDAQPEPVKGIRAVGRDAIHLTLHFLGEQAETAIEQIHRAFADFQAEPFEMTIRGVGRFPPRGPARVLWAGVEPRSPLMQLHARLGELLTQAIGFQQEQRPFHPHITLARVKEFANRRHIDDFLKSRQGQLIPGIPVEKVVLYSTRFVDNLPRYHSEAVLKLSSQACDR